MVYFDLQFEVEMRQVFRVTARLAFCLSSAIHLSNVSLVAQNQASSSNTCECCKSSAFEVLIRSCWAKIGSQLRKRHSCAHFKQAVLKICY